MDNPSIYNLGSETTLPGPELHFRVIPGLLTTGVVSQGFLSNEINNLPDTRQINHYSVLYDLS